MELKKLLDGARFHSLGTWMVIYKLGISTLTLHVHKNEDKAFITTDCIKQQQQQQKGGVLISRQIYV